ncbi:MAG: hypothetical protein HY553_00550 [Elusimicrobia bacterium]|nr:hypothetical protein [Elusimicrobiota bacterium]
MTRPPGHAVLLAAVVAVGAVVRLRGLGWGLPHTLCGRVLRIYRGP